MTQTIASTVFARPAGLVAEALAKDWEAAWNSHDMARAADLVMPSVDFVTVGGRWLRGREEFLTYHRQIHVMQMRDSQWTNQGWVVRTLRDDLILIHLEWAIRGDREPDGTPRSPRQGIFTWLAGRSHAAWRIEIAHNTNLRADTHHRLSASDGHAHLLHGENR